MGHTGTVEHFSLKRGKPIGQSDGDADRRRFGRTGAQATDSDNPIRRGRRIDNIGLDSPGESDAGIGARIFGDTGTEAEARHLGEESADAIRPKRKYTRRSKTDVGDPKPTVTAQMVKDYTTSTFGLIASLTKRDHWRVNRPDIEIDPWSEHAATLINNLPIQYADAIGKWGAAYAVALGLGGMVFVRVRLDGEQNAEKRAHRQPKPNPQGNRLITQDDLRETVASSVEPDQPYHVEMPNVEGAPLSHDALWTIYHYQQNGSEKQEKMEGTPHKFGKGGAEPLTPADTRGILG